MRVTRIFTSRALDDNCTVELEPEPSRHLAKALRAAVDDPLTVFDGLGGEYPARITAIGKKSVVIETGSKQAADTESPLTLHLGIGMSRGERMDWIVQKATELGITSLTPLVTARCGVRLAGERAAKKLRHWQQIAISACEQCGRNRLPDIHPPQDVNGWLADTAVERGFVLHHRAAANITGTAAPESAALLVGPEGGLSTAEITAAEDAGYLPLRLGPRVLRTETAPLAAIAILQSTWGDMKLP